MALQIGVYWCLNLHINRKNIYISKVVNKRNLYKIISCFFNIMTPNQSLLEKYIISYQLWRNRENKPSIRINPHFRLRCGKLYQPSFEELAKGLLPDGTKASCIINDILAKEQGIVFGSGRDSINTYNDFSAGLEDSCVSPLHGGVSIDLDGDIVYEDSSGFGSIVLFSHKKPIFTKKPDEVLLFPSSYKFSRGHAYICFGKKINDQGYNLEDSKNFQSISSESIKYIPKTQYFLEIILKKKQ